VPDLGHRARLEIEKHQAVFPTSLSIVKPLHFLGVSFEAKKGRSGEVVGETKMIGVRRGSGSSEQT
jgi:hypothetical protein